jgi:HipA-like protein
MNDQLITLLNGVEVGRVVKARSGGKLTFRYDEGWQSHPDAYPLSLSMPLALTEHLHAKIDAFLWGLLPRQRPHYPNLGTGLSGIASLFVRTDAERSASHRYTTLPAFCPIEAST